MLLETTRFGRMEVEDNRVLTFPHGVLGFESIQEYCLLDHKPGSPFLWLQATANPALAFVVVDPFEFIADYELTISDADVSHLQLDGPEDVRILTIITIAGEEISANLVGPILVNHRLRLARQVVLSDSRYCTRHSLLASAPAERTYSEVA
ncbi:MAG: flagellar assembly protein FliW [Armatimonadota bacterium]